MKNKQQKQIKQKSSTATSPNQELFQNPICRVTYDWISRIYGVKRKKIISYTSMEKQVGKISTTKKYSCMNNKIDGRWTNIKKNYRYRQNNINVSPSNSSVLINKKHITEFHTTSLSFTKKRKTQLPQKLTFQLQQLQTSHKVIRSQPFISKTQQTITGLQSMIINSKSKENSRKNLMNKTCFPSRKFNFTSLKKNQMNQANHNKQQIQQDQNQSNKSQQHQQKISLKKQSLKYKPQCIDDIQSVQKKSIHSQSINPLNFPKNYTKFHQFSQKNYRPKSNNKQVSKSSFKIPTEQQYHQYLKNYKCNLEEFSIKSLIKSQHFRILKGNNYVYFGEVDQNQNQHGKGLYISHSQIFQGEYKNGNKYYGCQIKTSGIYKGSFHNGLRSGNGTFKWNNGEVFEGSWKNGMKNGFGTWKSPNGSFYQGTWLQNKQHGQGIFKHKNSTYKGEFKNFLKNGKGIEVFRNGDKYEGDYENGKPHGTGRYQWKQGEYYQGEFFDGLREGNGRWIDANGSIYEGQFKRDFKHGLGKQIYLSGQRYQGQFYEGNRSNGKIYNKYSKCIQIVEKQIPAQQIHIHSCL